MSKISWGPTTVFNTPNATTGAPATPSFGFNTPTATNSTAATTTTTSAAPAGVNTPTTTTPTSGFSFSSPPASTPATATGTPSLFSSTPSSSTFNTNTFTSTPTTMPTGTPTTLAGTAPISAMSLEAPQQAALVAHRNAILHQEASRLQKQLTHFYHSYSPHLSTSAPNTAPTPAPTGSFFSTPAPTPNTNANATTQVNPKCQFQHIFYDAMTPAQTLEKQALLSGATGGETTSYPPKPNHVPLETWISAMTQNPDSNEYMPVLLTSAESLHSRIVQQQRQMNLHSGYISQLNSTFESLQQAHASSLKMVKAYAARQKIIETKLFQLLKKVELCRTKHVPLSSADRDALNKVYTLVQGVKQLQKVLMEVQQEGREYIRQLDLLAKQRMQNQVFGVALYPNNNQAKATKELPPDFVPNLESVLAQQEYGMEELEKLVKKDVRDLEILKKGRDVLEIALPTGIPPHVVNGRNLAAVNANGNAMIAGRIEN